MKNKLADNDIKYLMFTILSYKDLWSDAVAKELVKLNETEEEVISCKANKLKSYLKDHQVNFSKVNNEYVAVF
jgi:hypothetical protein